MDDLEILKKIVGEADGEGLVKTLSEGALKLDENHINTVQFVFWLVYMAETDLNDVIKEAWVNAMGNASEDLNNSVRSLLQEGIKGDKELDPENLDFFVDKIKIYQSFYGDDKRTKLFFKLNDIRNSLSHNRINDLTYNKENLLNIEIRKKLLIDYFESVFEEKDWTQSSLYKSLSPEDRAIIEAQFNTKIP